MWNIKILMSREADLEWNFFNKKKIIIIYIKKKNLIKNKF